MRVILQAVEGPVTGRRIEVGPGVIMRIGRTTKADYAIGEDAFLSGVHFAVECDGTQCRVRDMGSSNGTFINGSKVSEMLVAESDQVMAGSSVFRIHFEKTAEMPIAATGATITTRAFTAPMGLPVAAVAQAPITEAPPQSYDAAQQALIRFLYRDAEPLYAVLDGFREPRVPAFLAASGEQYITLGPPDARARGAQYPYLALVRQNSMLLDVLVKDAWGHGWGVYVTSAVAFDDVARHLSDIAALQSAGGRSIMLRYWDPGLLRALMPGLSAQECSLLFGPISRFIIEGATPASAVEYKDALRGARATEAPLE